MLRIAHVGHLGPDHEHDQEHEWIIHKFILDQLPELAEAWCHDSVIHDFIELRYGRDFLKESCQYDVVCLYFIFHPHHKTVFDHMDNGTEFGRSNLHTIPTWQQRLNASAAEYIFMLGSYEEISGDTMKEWYPYKIVGKNELCYLTAYQREGS